MKAKNIDEVVNGLMSITDRASREKSRVGYFSALYARVTTAVKRGLECGMFRDCDRMERFDVAFANRYFDALEMYRTGQPIPKSWSVALAACDSDAPTILQHLYVGLTAHLMLDLGVAAAETCPGDDLGLLRDDFQRINDVVASLMEAVDKDVGRASPWIERVERYAGRPWAVGNKFVMSLVRERAWAAAEDLVKCRPEAQARIVRRLDRNAAWVAERILSPSLGIGMVTRAVRARELNDVSLVIRKLLGE